jgi:hypothetical protein
LQSGSDAECRLFQKIAEQGHYAGRTVPSRTRQGTYATTADGRLLASWNSNDARQVARKLREAVKKWEELKAESVAAPKGARLDPGELRRDELFYPEDGLVLTVNTRDLPRAEPQRGRWTNSWNQDFAWFTKSEAERFVPDEAEVGREVVVPEDLVARLARLHFVDNVRGQTSSFPGRAVREARLTSIVTGVDGDVVTLRLEGRTKTELEGRWSIRGYRDMNAPSPQNRGVELKLLGNAGYDRKAGRFVHFEVVAVGDRWGGTQYNGRGNDLARAPFGVALTLAGRTHAERVAPEHFNAYGWR